MAKLSWKWVPAGYRGIVTKWESGQIELEMGTYGSYGYLRINTIQEKTKTIWWDWVHSRYRP